MSIVPVVLRNLVNAPATPAYPATGYTLHAEDMNQIRKAISLGQEAIYTKGIKLGADGIEVQTTTPFLMDEGAFLRFIDGGNDDAVVGSLTADGELAMTRFTVLQGLIFQADAWIRFQGSLDLFIPEQVQTNVTVLRGDADVLDLDVFFDSEIHALHLLYGTYVANKAGEGYAMRNATTVSRLRLRDDQVLVIEDAVDMSARPVTWTNEREIPTGVPGSTPIQEIVGIDGVYAIELLASPRTYQIGLEAAGVQLMHVDLGTGPLQINVDAIWAAGAGSGVAATLVTPAQRQAIDDLVVEMAAVEVALTERVKYLRMPDGTLVAPNASGWIQMINSSSALWDSPAAGAVRVVTSGGGGGGGGGVISVGAGQGLANSGSTTNPILDINLGAGLTFSGDDVVPDFGTTAGTVAEGNHLHTGVYSPVGHTHTGVYVPVGGAYADLVAASKIGTGSGQVAAGNDTRFHTQNTDTGTTSLTFSMRQGFSGTPANGDIVGITVVRGLSTNARVYFRETDDKWVAGIVGSEAALILEGDSRLSDARTPIAHALSVHIGQLDGDRVNPLYVPTDFTPTGPTLDDFLEGIDIALGAITPSTGIGQTFHASGDVSRLGPGQFLLGSAGSGVPAKGAGTLQSYSINTLNPLIGGSLTLKVMNITQATSANVTLNPGDFVKTGSLALGVADGDIIAVMVDAVGGVLTADDMNFTFVKE